MAAHLRHTQHGVARTRLAARARTQALARRIRPCVEDRHARRHPHGHGSASPRRAAEGDRLAEKAGGRQQLFCADTACRAHFTCSGGAAGISDAFVQHACSRLHGDAERADCTGDHRGERMGLHRTRARPQLRRAPADSRRSHWRSPRRAGRSRARRARRAVARRGPSQRAAPHHHRAHLESHRAWRPRNLRARNRAHRSRSRAAAQHAGTRACASRAARSALARTGEPHRARALDSAAQSRGEPADCDVRGISLRRVGSAAHRLRRRARALPRAGGGMDSGVATRRSRRRHGGGAFAAGRARREAARGGHARRAVAAYARTRRARRHPHDDCHRAERYRKVCARELGEGQRRFQSERAGKQR